VINKKKTIFKHLYRVACYTGIVINFTIVGFSLFSGYYQLIPLSMINVSLLSFVFFFKRESRERKK
jgi:hypothetical protein